MKQFACNSVIEGCTGVVEGETEEEVMAAAASHAASAHRMTDLSPELIALVRSRIVEA